MDNELDQLEAELKRLEPAMLSREMARRVERALGSAGRRPASMLDAGETPALPGRSSLNWWWAALLPAAAALVVIIALPQKPRGVSNEKSREPERAVRAAASSGETLKPVADESVLVSARDEGLVTLDDGTRARRERLQFVETITWKNPRTNASLIWSMPREEVRVVPISFQ